MTQLRVTVAGLNVREHPSTSGPIMGFLKMGDVVTLAAGESSESANPWRRVTMADGKSGWVNTKYTRVIEAQQNPGTPVPPPLWMILAEKELGVREVTGSGDNPRVLEYLRSTDLDHDLASHDSTPWCSAFANHMMELSGHAGTNSAWAKSWASWGVGVKKPVYGDVTVLTRDGGGHVAFFVKDNGDGTVRLLGGNQHDEVCYANFPKDRVIAFRRPAQVLRV